MDFSKKISIILTHNKLGIATMEDLSEKAGFHRDTIRKAIDRLKENGGKGSGLNKKNTRIFKDKFGINPDWWESGEGPVFLGEPAGNPTHGDIEPPVTENPNDQREGVYRTIVEGHTEYVLVPRVQYKKDERILNWLMSQLERYQSGVKSRSEEAEEKT